MDISSLQNLQPGFHDTVAVGYRSFEGSTLEVYERWPAWHNISKGVPHRVTLGNPSGTRPTTYGTLPVDQNTHSAYNRNTKSMAMGERKQQQQRQQKVQQQNNVTLDAVGPDGAIAGMGANLWESMLRDAMRRNRLPDGTLVFVGPRGCGKSSLLDTFLEGSASLANPSGGAAASAAAAAIALAAGDSGPESGAGVGINPSAGTGASGADAGQQAAKAGGFHPVLAYSYLDATDPAEQGPERDDSPPRVSVWCCSETEFEGLLQTVLRPGALENTAVVVGVDLSRPWEVMDAVKKVCACVPVRGGGGAYGERG